MILLIPHDFSLYCFNESEQPPPMYPDLTTCNALHGGSGTLTGVPYHSYMCSITHDHKEYLPHFKTGKIKN